MYNLVTLIPLFPLLGFLTLGLFGNKISKSLAGIIASGAIFISFALSVYLFVELIKAPKENSSFTYDVLDWIKAGNFSVSVVPISANIASVGAAKNYSNLNLMGKV